MTKQIIQLLKVFWHKRRAKESAEYIIIYEQLNSHDPRQAGSFVTERAHEQTEDIIIYELLHKGKSSFAPRRTSHELWRRTYRGFPARTRYLDFLVILTLLHKGIDIDLFFLMNIYCTYSGSLETEGRTDGKIINEPWHNNDYK